MADNGLILGLDIGTTKVCALVASTGERPQIVGAGTAPCEGLKKGLIVNPERAVQATFEALTEAERSAGVKLTEALIGIGGEHARGVNSKAVVAVGRSDGQIREGDVRRVCDAARSSVVSSERVNLHSLSQEFLVDGDLGVKEPVGLTGVRLEGHFHIITAAASHAQSITRCARRAGVRTREMVFLPYASSFSVLRPDEIELGVALIDIGGGTTGMTLFHDGSIRYSGVLPVGGWHVTNDITVGLRILPGEAEAIKINHGRALPQEGKPVEIAVSGTNGSPRQVTTELLGSIIEPRVEEILSLAAEQLGTSDLLARLGSGIVLTGGTSLLPEIAALGERVFEMPVRVGWPGGVEGLPEGLDDARFASAAGIVRYGMEEEFSRRGTVVASGVETINRAVGHVTDWIKDFF